MGVSNIARRGDGRWFCPTHTQRLRSFHLPQSICQGSQGVGHARLVEDAVFRTFALQEISRGTGEGLHRRRVYGTLREAPRV